MLAEMTIRNDRAARYRAAVARRRARQERWKNIVVHRMLITAVVIFLWVLSVALLLEVGA